LAQSKEADARILVDELLRNAGWKPEDKNQVLTEQKTAHGYADYVLLNRNGLPLAVIEAKREGINPYTAKQQALPYAKDMGANFIFLTNGDIIYFWDYQNDDARPINSFYSQKDLERLTFLRTHQKPLAEIEIPDHFLMHDESLELRPYQKETMQALDVALELGKRRFLIELPTGTGKTALICLYLKRLFDAGRADRALFLVDREQLAEQALGSMLDLFGGQFSIYWRKSGIVKQEKQITICLLQTMINSYEEYTSGYFDVVIADECHRSIYGAWQTALTYFDATHIGLTATPSGFIEKNTFDFYDCEDGKPDFSFPITEAIKEGFLAPYTFARGITSIIDKGADKEDKHYDPAQFEKKWTNEKTNELMMKKFDELAWDTYQDLAPGQKTGPGKTIIFAITKKHAADLAKILNKLHPECNGNYAQVITSDVQSASDLIRRFKHETYPQVAVSVGMLDTGFDCREVLHLVMCRRVRSPILYQQMRGRGTRTADHIQKQKFVIYDFFRNSEYFNDSDTDIFVDYGSGSGASSRAAEKKLSKREIVELGLPDEWLENVTYIEIGPEGERVDKKEYISTWKTAITDMAEDDEIIQKVRAGEELDEDEETELANRLNQPKNYFNEDNLRKAYQDRSRTLIDFIKAALGLIKVKTREQKIRENFNAWLITKNFSPDQASYLSLLKNRGIARGNVDINDLFKPPLSLLNAGGIGIELFGESGLKAVVDEMNQSLFIETA